MRKPFRFDPAAKAELDAAIAWYDGQQSGLGRELLQAVVDVLQSIQQAPLIGAAVAERLRSRKLSLKRFPYSVIYIPKRNEILVLAIAHAASVPATGIGAAADTGRTRGSIC